MSRLVMLMLYVQISHAHAVCPD